MRYRHAGYDDTGEPLSDWDVLSAEELAQDLGWVPQWQPRTTQEAP